MYPQPHVLYIFFMKKKEEEELLYKLEVFDEPQHMHRNINSYAIDLKVDEVIRMLFISRYSNNFILVISFLKK